MNKTTVLRKMFPEVIGILLAMLLAASAGNYIAQLATRQVDNTPTKFIAGILIGLLVGMAVGFLVKRASDVIRTRLLGY